MSPVYWPVDGPALACAVLAATLCGGLGQLLALRRQSLLGDALTHAVLPGIVLGLWLSGGRTGLAMFGGAAVAALLAAALGELVTRWGRIEASASLGVVFTGLFALGVVLIDLVAARGVDIDANCVLFGQLEGVMWLEIADGSPLEWRWWLGMPSELQALLVANGVALVAVWSGWRAFQLAAFDGEFAHTLGFATAWIHLALVALVTLALVAAFTTVGSILVIALLVLPSATARLWGGGYGTQLALAVGLGGLWGAVGYGAAAFGPSWFGYDLALNAAGAIGSVAALGLCAVAVHRQRPQKTPVHEDRGAAVGG